MKIDRVVKSLTKSYAGEGNAQRQLFIAAHSEFPSGKKEWRIWLAIDAEKIIVHEYNASGSHVMAIILASPKWSHAIRFILPQNKNGIAYAGNEYVWIEPPDSRSKIVGFSAAIGKSFSFCIAKARNGIYAYEFKMA